MGYKQLSNIAGWMVFGIATIIYAITAEPTGSLWDCGEFITGAYKLEVVHPPGAPVFLMIGRFFTMIAELINPEYISYSINLMSGICSAAAAMFVCWTTIIFGKISLVGREGETDGPQNLALAGAGLVAGLSTAFCSSIWFSAVEGEVYAMSTMFTTLVVWGMSKWYSLPDEIESDRWIVFSLFMAGMSIGVHLLSLLTLPAMALLYYFKKYDDHKPVGVVAAGLAGVMVMILIQYFVIIGVPTIWTWMEFMTVNGLGLPQHSGVVPLILLFTGVIWAGIHFASKLRMPELQYATVAFATILVAFSTIGVVVIRASVNTPINMNNPSNAMRLLPYVNREQYGERPLLSGPSFLTDPIKSESEDRFDYVEAKGAYEATDQKLSYVYPDNSNMLFPRLGHDREQLYMQWLDIDYLRDANNQPRRDANGKPILERELGLGDNLKFFFNYQIKWMYIRYFMWNFSGRQNGQQGYYSWDPGKGHWISGIPFIDNGRTGDASMLTSEMKNDQARNTYFMLPFIFGLIGMFYLFKTRPKEAFALLALFFMTGIAIIIYSNQPPNEPRERDYVLVGSFFTYCIFIGMGVLALFELFRNRLKLDGTISAGLASGIIIIAPALMGFQNYDDNNRAEHYGARDYASNFLNSVDENAIIFTYGDNDTYPLWYAQEVEEIRTDVRVVNLSLIQVDWYIDQLRRKVNDSEAIKFITPSENIRGKRRPQFLENTVWGRKSIQEVVSFMGVESHPVQLRGGGRVESHLPTRQMYIDVDSAAVSNSDWVADDKKGDIVKRMNFNIPAGKRIMKGDLAMLDIVASNINDRPIYYAVTVRDENLLGLKPFLQLEGLALRLVPVTTTKTDDDLRGLGVLGYGYVDADKMHENVTTKWAWGGFDSDKNLFVDDKYGPSTQSMHYAIKRCIKTLVAQGKGQKAEEMLDKYFQSFPNQNFAYDWTSISFMEMYADIGKYDKAKPHIEILLDNTVEQLAFLDAQDAGMLSSGSTFRNMKGTTRNTAILLQRLAAEQKDQILLKALDDRLGPYNVMAPSTPIDKD
ncbi:MAG: hypothetical protein ACI94Y_002186 [Maribacter sp.]|jgi:hypothetical protein